MGSLSPGYLPATSCDASPWPVCDAQVYASYRYRRDFAEVAKGGSQGVERLLRPLPRAAAAAGAVGAEGAPGSSVHSSSLHAGGGGGGAAGGVGGSLELDPPSMRQAIAWEFALRAIHQREVRRGKKRGGWLVGRRCLAG